MSILDGLPSRGHDDNLPYGTSTNDPHAPWNAPEQISCSNCGEDTWPGAKCAHCGLVDDEPEGPDPDDLRDAAQDREWQVLDEERN